MKAWSLFRGGAATLLATSAALVPVVTLGQTGSVTRSSHGTSGMVVQSVQDVAGQSPFAGLHCNAQNIQMAAGGRYGEPYIAINPKNPNNRIAAWMDRTRNTVDTAYTTNGGRSWHRSIPMGLDNCTGNTGQGWEGNADVWVSFAPNGIAYFTSIPWKHAFVPPFTKWEEVGYIQRSTDGGATWSAPVRWPNPWRADDKPMTVADNRQPGTVYIVDANEDEGTPIGERGRTELLFYRSRDGGRTFDIAHKELAGTLRVHEWFWNAQLAELHNGTLVVTYAGPVIAGHSADLRSRTSTNQGATWSAPVVIRHNEATVAPNACGVPISGLLPFPSQAGQTAVVDGHILAVASWVNPSAQGGPARIVVSVSDNAGRSWHEVRSITSNLSITMASIAGDNRGHLGVVYDQVDIRHTDCTAPAIPARTELAVATVHGGSGDEVSPWHTVTVGPRWWNFASSGKKKQIFGWWLGDFQSLNATPAGFTTITAQGAALQGTKVPLSGATGIIVGNVLVH